MAVLLETILGDIVVDLYTEARPKTCLNFLKLCKIKYYNYCLFHNVQRDFISQTGDLTGTGRGGDKLYYDQACFFDAEKVPRIKHKKNGTVSMVNNGNYQHGSQSGRIGADEAMNDNESTAEMDEILKEEEAKTQAIVLEMVESTPRMTSKPNKTKLALKDKAKPKQDSRYDLVLDEEDKEEGRSHQAFDRKQERTHHHHRLDDDVRKPKKPKESDESRWNKKSSHHSCS